ncbi:hypothetical protein PAL_GLEAN10017522 [Pteropus alecto]|uniref:Uncharacterized protein n=1 Tax=Pteropus alecto TaxID=9402 RepID=L5K3U2_PTEAL|nr:hypothetical protein PAL_GLEAN10017522 [Pteropus alecto]
MSPLNFRLGPFYLRLGLGYRSSDQEHDARRSRRNAQLLHDANSYLQERDYVQEEGEEEKKGEFREEAEEVRIGF